MDILSVLITFSECPWAVSITITSTPAFLLTWSTIVFILSRIGAAPFRGYGSSIKKEATDAGNDGMAYRVYGCGIRSGSNLDRMIISLESTVVLPK